MVETWVRRASARLFFAAGALAFGFALAVVSIQRGNFGIAAALFAIGLAALVGAGKLASP